MTGVPNRGHREWSPPLDEVLAAHSGLTGHVDQVLNPGEDGDGGGQADGPGCQRDELSDFFSANTLGQRLAHAGADGALAQGPDGDGQLHQPGRLLLQGPLTPRLRQFLPRSAQPREAPQERLIGFGGLRQRVHRSSSQAMGQTSADRPGADDYLRSPRSRQGGAARFSPEKSELAGLPGGAGAGRSKVGGAQPDKTTASSKEDVESGTAPDAEAPTPPPGPPTRRRPLTAVQPDLDRGGH